MTQSVSQEPNGKLLHDLIVLLDKFCLVSYTSTQKNWMYCAEYTLKLSKVLHRHSGWVRGRLAKDYFVGEALW